MEEEKQLSIEKIRELMKSVPDGLKVKIVEDGKTYDGYIIGIENSQPIILAIIDDKIYKFTNIVPTVPLADAKNSQASFELNFNCNKFESQAIDELANERLKKYEALANKIAFGNDELSDEDMNHGNKNEN